MWLIFAFLPQELTNETLSKFSLILYFMTLLLLSFGTHFCIFDAVMVWFMESFRVAEKDLKKYVVSIAFAVYLCGLFVTTYGGIYIYIFFNSKIFSWNSSIVSIIMLISVFLYGEYRNYT